MQNLSFVASYAYDNNVKKRQKHQLVSLEKNPDRKSKTLGFWTCKTHLQEKQTCFTNGEYDRDTAWKSLARWRSYVIDSRILF